MALTAATSEVYPNPIFEGSEKRVEIDFRLSSSASANGLRAIPRETLDQLMTLARCCIVSSRSNTHFDAYVLSESSLFVYPTKWVLKTCGTTRLLNAIPYLLEVAAGLGLEARRCKYTRASFLFPELQPFPYTSFDNEVEFLQQHFGALKNGGSAFVLGEPFNGLQWHVYIADDLEPVAADFKPTYNLEICMTELSPEAAQQFFRTEKFVSASQTTKDSGIINLKPKALMDDYVFEPCGYSMNGIDGTGLITIHITPEGHQSYASVEFSGFMEDMVDASKALDSVLKIFQPGKVSVAMSVDKYTKESQLWGNLSNIPFGYGVQGVGSQLQQCEGKVCYLTLVEKMAAPGSPITPLHHASSFLSVATSSNSDYEADSNSDPE